MKTSIAYYNHSRWVASCPADWCSDARGLYPQDPQTGLPGPHPVYVQHCAEGHEFRIEAPPDDVRARIEAALADRPPQFRDWLPNGHPWAANGYPTNQSPEDLVAEGEELKRRMAASKAAKRADMQEAVAGSGDIRDVLAALGVQVNPDGTFSGSI